MNSSRIHFYDKSGISYGIPSEVPSRISKKEFLLGFLYIFLQGFFKELLLGFILLTVPSSEITLGKPVRKRGILR